MTRSHVFAYSFILLFHNNFFFYQDVTCHSLSDTLFSLFPQAISRYLPRRDPVLKPLIYEMVLHEFLESDYEVLQPDVSTSMCPIVIASQISLAMQNSDSKFSDVFKQIISGQFHNNENIQKLNFKRIKRMFFRA